MHLLSLEKGMNKNGYVSSIKERELLEGHMKAARVRGNPILLVRKNGEVFGLFNRCLHMGCSLEGGILTDYILMCPCHGWKYDVRNGQYTENPLKELQTYRCKIEDGIIFVEIEKPK
jgi:nitrite reductase/ring-hydroxylating ferredoxin subunit